MVYFSWITKRDGHMHGLTKVTLLREPLKSLGEILSILTLSL
jgi:hypothetical protein